MKRRRKSALVLSLLFGGLTLSSLSGCAEQVAQTYNVNLDYDSSLGKVEVDHPSGTYGDTFTITITPNTGITIESILVNGEVREITNTFTITAEEDTYNITVNFNDPTNPDLDNFTVKTVFDSEMGSVVVDKTEGENFADPSSAVKVTVTPNPGYEVESIKVNGESYDTSVLVFAFQPKKGENVVEVIFKKVEDVGPEDKVYTISLDYDSSKGRVECSEPSGTLTEGKTVSLSVKPNNGYFVKEVFFNNVSLSLATDNVYVVSPQEGENTFKVVFDSTTPVTPENTFTIELDYDSTKGNVSLDKTSGNVGEKVTLTVAPNANFEVSTILFNGAGLPLESDNIYEIEPVAGTNTIKVDFKETVVEPAVKYFNIELLYNNEGGEASVDKTEGEVGETIILTVAPKSGYQVSATFNDGPVTFDDSYQSELRPVEGKNTINVNFFSPEEDMMKELESGFDISTDYTSLFGETDVDRDYFIEKITSFALNITPDSSTDIDSISLYIGTAYDVFVSKTRLKKATLEKVFTYIESGDFYEKIATLTTSNSFGPEQIKTCIEIFGPLVNVIDEDEFTLIGSIFMMCMGYTAYFVNNYSLNSPISSLDGNEISNAISYFENKQDNEAASYLKTAYQTTNKILDKEELIASLKKVEPVAVFASRFLYNFLKKGIETAGNLDNLAQKVSDLITAYTAFGQGNFDSLKENAEKNLELIQFLGSVLYRCMPNLESFKGIVNELQAEGNVIQGLFEFSRKLTNYPNFETNAFADIFNVLKEKGDSFYYVLKFIGKCLEKATAEDYNSILTLINSMAAGTQENLYGDAIRVSKLFVRNLTSFGSAAATIRDNFAEGIEAFGELMSITSRVSVHGGSRNSEVNESGATVERTTLNLYVRSGDNAFKDYDFTQISKFITEASTYDPSNVTDEQKAFISNTFAGLQEAANKYMSYENADYYVIEYYTEQEVGGKILKNVIKPEKLLNEEVNFDSLQNIDTTKPGSFGVALNVNDLGNIYIPYQVGLLISSNYLLRYTDEQGKYNEEYLDNILVFEKGDTSIFDNEWGVYVKDFSIGQMIKIESIKDLNIDTSSTGLKYSYLKLGQSYYFFKYIVYSQKDVKTSYYLNESALGDNQFMQGIDAEIDSIEKSDYITYEITNNDGKTITEEITIDWSHFSLDEPINLDTSKVGENTVTINLTELGPIPIGYYVCETTINSRKLNSSSSSNGPKFLYQNVEISADDEFTFEIMADIEYKDKDGKNVEANEICIGDITLKKDDFGNKLSNSTPGKATDTYIDEDENVYIFDYYVFKRLAGGDEEFKYYVDGSYLPGLGFVNSKQAIYCQRLFFEDHNGNAISYLNTDSSKTLYLDFSSIMIDESNLPKNDFAQISFTYDDIEYNNIYVYVCNDYSFDYANGSINESFTLNQQISDDEIIEIDISFSGLNYINGLTGQEDWIGYNTIKRVRYGDIKHLLDLTTSGSHYFTYSINGLEFEVHYSVENYEAKNLTIGDEYTIKSDSANINIDCTSSENYLTVCLTGDDVSNLGYDWDGKDIGFYDSEQGLIVFVFDVNDVTNFNLNLNGAENITVTIQKLTNVNVDPNSLVSYNPDSENRSITFDGLELQGSIVINGETYLVNFLKFEYTVSYDTLLELYKQSGGGVVKMEIEYMGHNYTITFNIDEFLQYIQAE